MSVKVEFIKMEDMVGLAKAIFDRIAGTEGDAMGLFTAATAAEYSTVLGRDVKIEEIQPVANQLLDANLIMRRGHGKYCISDPFVQEVWKERQRVQLA